MSVQAKRITVHKLDDRGAEVWRYEGEVILRSEDRVVLEARFDRDEVEFHGIRLERGDIFVETFFADRWYNVFAVHDRDKTLFKCWYCNIARPARISRTDVYAEDLALDLIVFPDGSSIVLDEDEFRELALASGERARAVETLQALEVLARNLEPPFTTEGVLR
jgi:predicted RNA-binding protein associated with RNAse of E/G family